MESTKLPVVLSANDARLQFSGIINRAIYLNNPTIVIRHNKPAVVLLAYDEWMRLEAEKAASVQNKGSTPVADAP